MSWQNFEAGLVGHVVIEANDVERLRLEPFETRRAEEPLDLETARLQRLLHQSRQARVVIDIQHSSAVLGHCVSGTCITAKNKPS